MNNKNLIIGGVVLAVAGIAYYLYNKNKGGGLASISSSSVPMTATDTTPIVSSNIPSSTFKGGSPAVGRTLTEQEKQEIRNDLFNGKVRIGDCSNGRAC
jgi:hypothetical protein